MQDVSVSLPGPGTAALFGSALVFVALALGNLSSFQKLAILVSIAGGLVLLATGIVIECKSFKERAWERSLKEVADGFQIPTKDRTAQQLRNEILAKKGQTQQ